MAAAIKLSPMVAAFLVDAKGIKTLDDINKSINARGNAIGKSMRSLGRVATMGLTAPIVAMGAASTKMAMDFNAGMANVASLMPGQGARIESMKKDVLALSGATGLMTDDLTKGLYQTISAFGDAGDPVKKLAITARAAKAGLASAEEGINLISATTLAYGDSSEAALQKVSDLALLTVRLGKTTFPELSDSIGRVASSGNALGVSQEELFASFATLSGVTGKTTEVSTQMSAVLGGMMKPTEGMKKLMKSLGFASTETMMKEKGLSGTLDILREATGGSTAKLGKLFESKEALLAVTALLGPQAQTYTDKLNQMKNAAGTTTAALNEQENGVNKTGAEFEKAKRRIEATMIVVGDKLMPVLAKLLDKITPIIDSFSKLSDDQINFRLKLLAGAAAIGPMLIGMGALVSAVFKLRAGYGMLKGAMLAANVAKAAGDATELSGSMTAAATSTDKLAGKLSTLGKASAVGAAAAVGVAIGTALSNALQEIDAAGKVAANRTVKGSIKNYSLTDQQLEAKRARVAQELESKATFTGGFGRRLSGMFGYDGGQQEFQALQDERAQISKILKERSDQQWKAEGPKFTADTFAPLSGMTPATPQTIDVNLKIDAPPGTVVGAKTKGKGKTNLNTSGGAIMAAGANL